MAKGAFRNRETNWHGEEKSEEERDDTTDRRVQHTCEARPQPAGQLCSSPLLSLRPLSSPAATARCQWRWRADLPLEGVGLIRVEERLESERVDSIELAVVQADSGRRGW